MVATDYIIIAVYFLGLIALGTLLGRNIKSSKEMFIAGKNSSWWLSGLSTYMTIFSASTFVVWGGVAYRSGVVAIVVGLMLGVASLIIGKWIAGKWASMDISSPAEYLGIRYGKPMINFFTITGMIGKGFHTAVALYAVAVMAVVLMPLPEGSFFADPETGHLSVTWAILVLGVITLVYTTAGGFIAVLITDLLQFAILMAMILIMIPMSFNAVGGIPEFIRNAPPAFFHLFTSQYSWVWMVLWLFLNVFMLGGDWAFVQRYISVPSIKDAKKTSYLVAALYLVTPLFFYVPTLTYRLINGNANPEQAYMMMSQFVLPAGMLGMMMAAMLSATMSMASGNLNVYANVFTYDIYKQLRPKADDRKLMRVGRTFTFLYGAFMTIVAILIPYLGGAEKVVVSLLTLVISPLFIPSIWGLYSKHISQKNVFIAMGITYVAALLTKSGVILHDFVSAHPEFTDAFIGLVFPVTFLAIFEIATRRGPLDPGWERLAVHYRNGEKVLTEEEKEKNKKAGSVYSNFAFNILSGSYVAIGIVLLLLSIFNEGQHTILLICGATFLGISLLALGIRKFVHRRKHC